MAEILPMPEGYCRGHCVTALQLDAAGHLDDIKVPPGNQRINELVGGKRGLTPSTARRLARYFGMSLVFWTKLQMKRDLYLAEQKEKDVLRTIKPYRKRVPA